MKILFINMSLNGHHLDYKRSLSEINNIESVVISPKASESITARQIILDDCIWGSMRIFDHLKWINKVKKITNKENPDYVHFTWGDSFYRFFALGFSSICRKYRCGITFHQVRRDKMHMASIKSYSRLFQDVIVHTNELKNFLTDRNVKNVRHIEYPNFRKSSIGDGLTARNELGIHTNAKILLCLGGTRVDKGLDILLKALNDVKIPFFLLIAGAEQEIRKDFIYSSIEPYRANAKVILRFLSDRELECCLCAANYIVLPYRKSFDGASGPLAEGVGYGKCIIGPNHGSLGQIIQENHLGYTFQTEDIPSLTQILEKALSGDFQYDAVASHYRNSLTVKAFQDEHYKLYDEIARRE